MTSTINGLLFVMDYYLISDFKLATSIVSPNTCDLALHKVIFVGFDEDSSQNIQGKDLAIVLSVDSIFVGVFGYKNSQHYIQYMKFTNTPALLSYKFYYGYCDMNSGAT